MRLSVSVLALPLLALACGSDGTPSLSLAGTHGGADAAGAPGGGSGGRVVGERGGSSDVAGSSDGGGNTNLGGSSDGGGSGGNANVGGSPSSGGNTNTGGSVNGGGNTNTGGSVNVGGNTNVGGSGGSPDVAGSGGSPVVTGGAGGAPLGGPCTTTAPGAILDNVFADTLSSFLFPDGTILVQERDTYALCVVPPGGTPTVLAASATNPYVANGVVLYGLVGVDDSALLWKPGLAAPVSVPISPESIQYVAANDDASVAMVQGSNQKGDDFSLFAYDFASGTTTTVYQGLDFQGVTQKVTRTKSTFIYGTNGQVTSRSFTGETHVLAPSGVQYNGSQIDPRTDLVITGPGGICYQGGVVVNASTGAEVGTLTGKINFCSNGVFLTGDKKLVGRSALSDDPMVIFDLETGTQTTFDDPMNGPYSPGDLKISPKENFALYRTGGTQAEGDALQYVMLSPLGKPVSLGSDLTVGSMTQPLGAAGTTNGNFVLYFTESQNTLHALPISGGGPKTLATGFDPDGFSRPFAPVPLGGDSILYPDGADVVIHDLATDTKTTLVTGVPLVVSDDQRVLLYANAGGTTLYAIALP